MARLNISIPDPLHARLERLRDRLNLSEVCTVALDRAAAELEAQPAGGDPLVAQMLGRLRTAHDVWRRRGGDDGRRWAAERATLDDLETMAAARVGPLYRNNVSHPPEPGEDTPALGTVLPDSFDLNKAIGRWVDEDLEGDPRLQQPPTGLRETATEPGARRQAEERVEYRAYLEGWTASVQAMWKAASTVLRAGGPSGADQPL
jgi:hypothetical protein